MASQAPAVAAARILLAALVLLIILIMKMEASEAAAVEYWEKLLPNVPLPAQLRQRVSPLEYSTELVTHYKAMTSPAGRLVQPASICMPARLYCDAKQFAEFRLAHPFCNFQSGFRNPTPAAHHPQSQGNFFKESVLLQLGSHLLLKDQKITTPSMSFLPRQLAELFQPLNAQLLQEAFSIPSATLLGKESMQTSKMCKEQAKELLQGEEAFCAFSLEDIADHLKGKVVDVSSRRSVRLLLVSSGGSVAVQAKLLKVEVEAEGTQSYLSCHPQTYPFAVHMCHHIPNTRIYSATLQSTQGELIQAVAVCHMDTSEWSPLHVAFSDLHSIPGHTEACHWTHENSLIFVPTK